jgi:capsular polysaccharide biosynthesis protein
MPASSRTTLTRRWWVVALLAAIGAVAGYGFFRLTSPTYVARAYVAAVARDPGNNAAAVSYAQAFARIVPQGDVVNAAASLSAGRYAPAELRRQVRATASPDAPVIELAGSAGSAQRAADVANLMAAGLVSTATKHSADTRIAVVLLSAADLPAEPDSPQRDVDIAVGAAVGVLLGGLVVLTRGHRGRGPARSTPDDAAELTDDLAGPTLPSLPRTTVVSGPHQGPRVGPRESEP